jgi:hypothetical protein
MPPKKRAAKKIESNSVSEELKERSPDHDEHVATKKGAELNESEDGAASDTRRLQFPTDTAIKCGVKTTRLEEKIKTILQFLRERDKEETGRDLFKQKDAKLLTPCGKVSKAKKDKTKTKTTKSTTRERTGITTLNKHFLIGVSHIFGVMYTEVYMGLCYLEYRINAIKYVNDELSLIITLLEIEMNPKLREENKDLFEKYGDINFNEALAKWATKFTALKYIMPFIDDGRLFNMENPETLVRMGNLTRLKTQLDIIKRRLVDMMAIHHPKSIHITNTDDGSALEHTIIARQPDFEYPFGRSFLEVFYVAVRDGKGYKQLKDLNPPKPITEAYQSLCEEFEKDFQANLLPELQITGVTDVISVKQDLYVDMGRLLADAVFYLSIQIYNYLVAATDKSTQTTFNPKTFKIVLSQFQSSTYSAFTPEQFTYMDYYISERQAKE